MLNTILRYRRRIKKIKRAAKIVKKIAGHSGALATAGVAIAGIVLEKKK